MSAAVRHLPSLVTAFNQPRREPFFKNVFKSSRLFGVNNSPNIIWHQQGPLSVLRAKGCRQKFPIVICCPQLAHDNVLHHLCLFIANQTIAGAAHLFQGNKTSKYFLPHLRGGHHVI